MSTNDGMANEEMEIKLFFKRLEAMKPGKADASADYAYLSRPDAIVAAVQRRVPAVVGRTKMRGVNNPRIELANEFFIVAAETGLERFKSGYTLGQYVTLLLYEAANRLMGIYFRNKHHSMMELPEGDIPAITREDDEQPLKPKRDPLQTVAQVKAVLGELSQTLQRTATRVWFEGHKQKTVAAEENVSPDAISLRLFRVRRHLSARLGIPLNLHEKSRRPRRRSRRLRAD
jgi:DNA-directed RNA polymerase specialized sigma24 family protein